VVIVTTTPFSRGRESSQSAAGSDAYKFLSAQATTVVADIKVQVGATGALTPVAVMRR